MLLTPILIAPKGVNKPVRAAYNVYSCMKQGQQFFEYQLGGKTFDLGGVITVTLTETWTQITTRRAPAKINGGNIWRDAFKECLERGLLGSNPLADHKGYYVFYLRPPTPEPWLEGFGGMIGLEDYRPNKVARPGMAMIADEKTWIIAGKSRQALYLEGWPMPSHANNIIQSISSTIHEDVHIASDIPHNDDWNADTITLEWWLGAMLGGLGQLTQAEKSGLLATGFFA